MVQSSALLGVPALRKGILMASVSVICLAGFSKGSIATTELAQLNAAAASVIASDKSKAQETSLGSGQVVKAADNADADTDDKKRALGAANFIDNMGSRALNFLKTASEQNMTEKTRRARFRDLLLEAFDMKTIGRFSMGRYWRVATPRERKEYIRLFENMVVDVYSNRFREYSGQHFEIRDKRPVGKRDAIVRTAIIPGEGPEVNVDWRVRYKDKRYQIIDVIVEGVSMSVTQRSDFASVIQRGGGKVDVLIAHLQER